MRILIAADKFKGSLTAHDACQTIARSLAEALPEAQADICPLTDGGDGFARVLTEACSGMLAGVQVRDPLDQPAQAQFGVVCKAAIPQAARERLHLPQLSAEDTAQVAIVEMAAASGLSLLPAARHDPWKTNTVGTGELIAAAARMGAEAILIGLGGSATHDLGLGALAALGYRFLNERGKLVENPAPEHWHRIHRIEGGIDADMPPLRIACDVTNPLLGDNGAAAVYAPQKGLLNADLPRLEAQSLRIAQLLCKHHKVDAATLTRLPGTGAAGGLCFGLLCAFGDKAQIVSGFDLVADWLQLHERLRLADRVITGEGRFDKSSLSGKGPGSLIQAALQACKPVDVFAGSIAAHEQPGLRLHAIAPKELSLPEAILQAEPLLRQAVLRVFTKNLTQSKLPF